MKLFRTYFALFLAMLIFSSASGINLSLHKCCGSVKSFSLFGEARECKMAKKPASCSHSKSKDSLEKTPCCTNQKVSFNESNKSLTKVSPSSEKKADKEFDVLFFYTLVKNWLGDSEPAEENHKPSPGVFIVEALILLLQQFRI